MRVSTARRSFFSRADLERSHVANAGCSLTPSSVSSSTSSSRSSPVARITSAKALRTTSACHRPNKGRAIFSRVRGRRIATR